MKLAHIILIFAFGTALYSLALSLPVFTHGEAREALVITAMIDQHNLVLPLRNGTDIPSKPPMYHWWARGLAAIGGDSIEMYRLASVLASALALSLFSLFAARRLSTRSAILATLALGTSLDWVRYSALARVDMVFTFFTLASTLAIFRFVEGRIRGANDYRALALSVPLLACAALTKGPAGIILPWAINGLFVVLKAPKKTPIVGAALSALSAGALAGTWYYAAYKQGGQAFLDVQLLKENLARITGSDEYALGHKGSALSMPGMLLAGLLPWSLFLPLFVAALREKARELWSSRDLAVPFCLLWAVFYLVFFSFSSSKRNVYLLPSFPAWAYLFGAALERLETYTEKWRAGWKVTSALLAGFALVLVALTALLVEAELTDIVPLLRSLSVKAHDAERVVAVASGAPAMMPLFALASLLAVLTCTVFRKRHAGVVALGLAVAVVSSAVSLFAMPVIANEQSPESFLLTVPELRSREVEVLQFKEDYFAVNYYLRRPIPVISAEDRLTNGRPTVILTSEAFLDEARSVLPSFGVIAESTERILDGKKRLIVLARDLPRAQ